MYKPITICHLTERGGVLDINNYNNENMEKHYWAFYQQRTFRLLRVGGRGYSNRYALVQKHASFDIPLDIQLGSKISNISTKPVYHNNNLHFVSCLST